MIRTLPLVALTMQGCIIYEERVHDGSDDPWDDDCGACDPGTGTGDDDDDDDDAPEPEEPQITADLALTETSGYPGDSLLSSLVVVSGQIDLTSVEAVSFERDVQVLDTIARPDEVVLLLAIAADAAPGEVDVFVESAAGAGWILAEPFTILEPAGGGGGGDGGGDGGGTCTPGGSTGDTGCP